MRIRRARRNCGTEQPISRYSMVFEAIKGKRRIGCLRIDDTGEGVTPFWSWVDPDVRRSGIGTRLYEAAARGACARFKQPLSSDTRLSEEARGFWEKQRRKGRATCELYDGPDCLWYQLRCPAPESLAGRRARRYHR